MLYKKVKEYKQFKNKILLQKSLLEAMLSKYISGKKLNCMWLLSYSESGGKFVYLNKCVWFSQ